MKKIIKLGSFSWAFRPAEIEEIVKFINDQGYTSAAAFFRDCARAYVESHSTQKMPPRRG